MAPSRKTNKTKECTSPQTLKRFSKKYFNLPFLKSLLFDPQQLPIVASFLLLFEIAINLIVINKVKYTEIDWKAYMQEVEGVANGTFDYSQLRGDTGPLVYPAGFVYIFLGLYYVTEFGKNVKIAQYIFIVLYILTLFFVFKIYMRSRKVPPYVLIISCCTSYRIHSIFVLRLFNDPVAVLLLYFSINLFLDGRWSLGSIFYSIAVSVKMNILLYSPALLIAYATSLGLKQTIKQLLICAFVQAVLGAPFLLTNPLAYMKGSFDLSRVFLYQWTVNWRFLPEAIFRNGLFHIGLLVLHILIILWFSKSWYMYLQAYARLQLLEKQVKPQLSNKKEKFDMGTSSQLLLLPLFTANLIGVSISRSLHYQFYIWYFHTLPYLLWSTPFNNTYRLILMGFIEFCWNTFPSTSISSALLHFCHVTLLYGVSQYGSEVEKPIKNR